MQKLTETTFVSFVQDHDTAIILFGAPEGEATMDQAVQHAEAWIDANREAGFAYVDAFAQVALARTYAIRVLPTTLVIRDGEVGAWLEGRHASSRITATLRAHAHPHARAA